MPPKPTDNKTDPNEAYNSVMAKIMILFAWLAGVAMLTLEYSMYWMVVKMGTYVNNLGAVGQTWTIFRDLGNIMLIFGFLAIGITTILNVDWYGKATKMLPMLLIVAVFLNFSLFVSQAIIDTGNLFATQFYKNITGSVVPQTQSFGEIATVGSRGISGKIMAQLGLQAIYGQARDEATARALFAKANPWTIGFMGVLLFIVLAFVLFSLAFVLIARFVILLFLMIIAPIGFAGLAVPQLESKAKQWWDMLFKQTLTAPVLLLLLYIALKVITSTQFLIGGNNSDILGFVDTKNLAGFGSIILSFLVAMGLLIAVVIAAKELSAVGAGAALNLGKKMGMGTIKFAGRSALGTGKWAANRTAGRGLHGMRQMVLRSPLGQTQAGRLAAGALGKVGGDAFKKSKEESVKKHEDYVKSVKGAIDEKHAPAIAKAQQLRAAVEAPLAENLEKKTKTYEDARRNRDAVQKETKPKLDEVARLQKIVDENRNKNNIDPNAISALNKAKADAKPDQDKLDKANKEFEAAEEVAESAKEEMKKNPELIAAQEEEKRATEALAKAKREAAVAYGANLQEATGLGWVAAGPGGFAAGNKIIQDTLKKMTETEKAIDMLNKAFKEEAKAAAESAKAGKKLGEARENLAEKTEKEAEEEKPKPKPESGTT